MIKLYKKKKRRKYEPKRTVIIAFKCFRCNFETDNLHGLHLHSIKAHHVGLELIPSDDPRILNLERKESKKDFDGGILYSNETLGFIREVIDETWCYEHKCRKEKHGRGKKSFYACTHPIHVKGGCINSC